MANQDFTTYTKVDPNSRFTVTSTRITASGLLRNEDAYNYWDFGAGYFDGDLAHLITTKSETTTTGIAIYHGLFNIVDDFKGIKDAGGDGIFIFNNNGNSIILSELHAGAQYNDAFAGSLGTVYYVTFERDEAVGTYGTLYCYIYSDASRETLVDTLSVALHEKEDFRYNMLVQSNNDGTTTVFNGYVENLDLQEAVDGLSFMGLLGGVG